jgi:hypothetical protein
MQNFNGFLVVSAVNQEFGRFLKSEYHEAEEKHEESDGAESV